MRQDGGSVAVSIDLRSGVPRLNGAELRGPARTGSRNLLLVEDDQALRQMLEWELSELGYRVEAVGSFREANAAVSARQFEVALLDVGLPDGNGAALARELAGANAKLKIVLCSGRFAAVGLDRVPPEVLACLAKPVSVQQVDALFRTAIRPETISR